MTILGAILHPDHALLWNDTETYVDGQLAGERPKLAINPSAGCACVGTGSMGLIREAAAVVHATQDIDEVERAMPSRLRKRAAGLAPHLVQHDAGWFAGNLIIAAGFSPTAGRMIAWRFAAAAFFEPVLVSRLCCPSDPALDTDIERADSVRDLERIACIARRQIALLRSRGLPDATGGTLVIAELAPAAVRCWRLPDFDVPSSSEAAVNAAPDVAQAGQPTAGEAA